MIFEFSECEELLGYKFKDSSLFVQCFTHASYTNENLGAKNNERLEFFGDKIIDFTVTEYLFEKYPMEELIIHPRLRSDFYKGAIRKGAFEKALEQIKVPICYNGEINSVEDVARIKATLHSSAAQAATLAKKAEVKQLIIGHYSARYDDRSVFLDEARAIFPNTQDAFDGANYIF
jgi:hypothetical protein